MEFGSISFNKHPGMYFENVLHFYFNRPIDWWTFHPHTSRTSIFLMDLIRRKLKTISSRQSQSRWMKTALRMAYHEKFGACVRACMLMTIRLIVQIENTLRCNLPMFQWIIKLFPLIDTVIYQRLNIWYAICVHTSSTAASAPAGYV